MFFTKLTRKTQLKGKKELKYKLLFWNYLYGLSDANLTHKLDYLPEDWFVVNLSALHMPLIYDMQTMNESLYYNFNGLSLKIKNMSIDYNKFPSLDRMSDLVTNEWLRIRLIRDQQKLKHNWRQEKRWKFNYILYDSFLATNTIFLHRLKK